jgi:hypothetical protein
MESTAANKYQRLVRMLGSYVAGENRSIQFVRDMNVELWATGLNDDDRFSDLVVALDLFEDFGRDEMALASECQYALRLLKEQP